MKSVRPNLEDTFALLEQCAVAGERCPKSSEPDADITLGQRQDIRALVQAGRIRIEVSGQNFRQIEILSGPHAGKKTAANPDPLAKVWHTIDKTGQRINGKLVIPHSRRQPSKPPTADELLAAASRLISSVISNQRMGTGLSP